MQDLNRLLHSYCVNGSADKWVWDDRNYGAFSVANFKAMLWLGRDQSRDQKMKWESWVPVKVNLVAWRTEFDRLPSRIALSRRGVQIVDTSCPLCAANVEDLNHLFVGCGHAYGVWNSICKWCKIDPFFAYDCEDLLLYMGVNGGKKS